jgi:hypothetical protein
MDNDFLKNLSSSQVPPIAFLCSSIVLLSPFFVFGSFPSVIQGNFYPYPSHSFICFFLVRLFFLPLFLQAEQFLSILSPVSSLPSSTAEQLLSFLSPAFSLPFSPAEQFLFFFRQLFFNTFLHRRAVLFLSLDSLRPFFLLSVLFISLLFFHYFFQVLHFLS